MAFLTKQTEYFKTTTEPNVNEVGSWSLIEDKVASSFKTANAILLPDTFDVAGGKTWEIGLNFETGSNVTTEGSLTGTNYYRYDPVTIGVTSSHFELEVCSGTRTSALTLTGSYVVQPNTKYWLKVTFDGSTYTIEYSLDGEEYIVDATRASTASAYSQPLILGGQSASSNGSIQFPWQGVIYIDKCYMKIDGEYWWQGGDYSLIGSWIDNGVASGFTTSDYLPMVGCFNTAVQNSDWEIVGKIHTGTVGDYNPIYGGASGTYLMDVAISANGTFHIDFSSNGSSYDIGTANGTYVVQANTDYWVKVTFDGTRYALSYSLDGIDYIEDAVVTSSTQIERTSDLLNIGFRAGQYFRGSIDLTECYVKIDGKYWWTGTKLVEIDAKDITDFGTTKYYRNEEITEYWKYGKEANATVVGSFGTVLNGVASGFSTSQYLTYTGEAITANTFEQVIKITTGSDVTTRQAFLSQTPFKGLGTLQVFDNHLIAFISSNGSTNNITDGALSNLTLNSNTDYWVKYTFNGSTYNIDVSTNSQEYVNYISIANSSIITSDGLVVLGADTGHPDSVSFPFSGSIDLTQSYININSETWWHGTKAVESTADDYDYTTEKTISVEVPEGEPYDYSVTTPSDQYTYSQTRNRGYEIARRKSFYYAYTDELETLRTGDWGTLTDEGIASGFNSGDDYLILPEVFDSVSGEPWEIVFKFTTGSDTSTAQNIFDNTATEFYGIGLFIHTSKMHISAGAGGSWIVDQAGVTTLSANTTYWFKGIYNGSSYIFYLSTDGVDWNEEINVNSSTPLNSSNVITLGHSSRTGYFFQGSIDLSQSYINISGERWWDWKTSTIPNGTRLENLRWDRNGIISSANVAANVLLLPEEAQPTGINWEVVIKTTTSSDVSGSVQTLMGGYYTYNAFILDVINGVLQIYASSNGTSWDIANAVRSSLTISPNTLYYFKFSYDGVKYVVAVSTDGSVYNDYITVETSAVLHPCRMVLLGCYGGNSGFGAPYRGSVDLSESYIQIGDNIVWRGMKTLTNPDYYFNFNASWIRKDTNTGNMIVGQTGSGTYMRTSRPVFTTYKKDIDVCVKVKMVDAPFSVGDNQRVMAPNYGTYIWGFRANGTVARYNNSAWAYGTTVYYPGQWVWLRVKWDGSNYYTYSLLDNDYNKNALPDISEWTLDNMFASTTNIFSNNNIFLGWDDQNTSLWFRGDIDYTNTFVRVDGKEVWSGVQIKEIPSSEVTVDVEYYKEIRNEVDTLTYACYSANNRYVYARTPLGAYDTVYCYRGNDMSVATTDASMLANSGYTFTELTEETATFDLVGDYTLPRYTDGDIYRRSVEIETVPGTPDDYTYTKISGNYGFTETRLVAAPLINATTTKRYYFRVLLDTDVAGDYTITVPDGSEFCRVTGVGGGGAAAMRGQYDDKGYGWSGGSAGAFEAEFALSSGDYSAVVASANNNTIAQSGNTQTLNPPDATPHDTYIDGVVRIGGGGCGHYSSNYVGAAGASATFDVQPQNIRLNTTGRAGNYGSGGKGSAAAATVNGAVSVYNGYGQGQGCRTSEYAGKRSWINGTGGYLKVVSASLSPEGGYDYFEDILKG